MSARKQSTGKGKKMATQAAAIAQLAQSPASAELPSAVLEQVIAGAEQLQRLAVAADKREEAICELPADASTREVRTARRRQSVSHGKHVYLPSWDELAFGLPSSLLRSALFSVSNSHKHLNDVEIANTGEVAFFYTGESLNRDDRRIYATCLAAYREKPLGTPIAMSVWHFIEAMDGYYSEIVHVALLASLKRLHAAVLRGRVGRFNRNAPRMLEFTGWQETCANEDLQSSDLLEFCITESMAGLFGPADWAQVTKKTLRVTHGLAAWTVSFYRTHSVSSWVPVAELQRVSGYTATASVFRAKLKVALASLQSDDIPLTDRVAGVQWSDKAVRVIMHRFN